jgi:hypothetical protein
VGLVAGEQRLGFVIADRAGDDDIAALFPVGRRRHLVPGRQLGRPRVEVRCATFIRHHYTPCYFIKTLIVRPNDQS